MRRQHVGDRRAEREIGEPDDARDQAVVGGDGRDPLGLAHRAQVVRAVWPVGRSALDEEGAHDRMPRGIRDQVVDEIDRVGVLPEMVVRIADRDVGGKRGFHGRPRQIPRPSRMSRSLIAVGVSV